MFGLRPDKLPDDRGRLIDVWSPASPVVNQGADPAAGEMPPEVRARVMSAWSDPKFSLMRAPFNRGNRPFLLLAGGLIVAYLLALVLVAFVFRSSGMALAIPVLAFGLAWAFLQKRWRRLRLGAAVRETLVAEGLCASCGYRLGGLAAETDGCTVCPECGAAWKLSTHASRVAETTPGPAVKHDTLTDGGAWMMIPSLSRLKQPRVLATLDDSGKLVTLVDPAIRRHPPVGWDTLPESEQDALARRLRRLHLARRLLLVTGALLYFFFDSVMLRRAFRVSPALSVGFLVNLLPVVFLTWAGVAFLAMALRPPIKDRRKYAGIFLELGRCACCLTEMDHGFMKSEGRATCSSCGASWSLKAPE